MYKSIKNTSGSLLDLFRMSLLFSSTPPSHDLKIRIYFCVSFKTCSHYDD